ncbi:MAG TPA: precorrin-8X methylmutase [Candidatus Lachnoclostridium stercorigallinarum]|uniref:Precorrin-8X methylmutase n=1 Tax=Candidatus Lachnoclostridium stercorigallinarum TaxID=2838634 RepID=A0A9D2K6V7_9FIRM|nr:precorrin-8X methylmutase [Candidatus Lachnoclostridium stercorigallinarum]
MEIIGREMGERAALWPPEELLVVKRCIHTSADFDYGENLVFSPGAVKLAVDALKKGVTIVTDTSMAAAGINKRSAAALGVEVRCFISDPDVAEEAKSRGVTRSAVCMERAAALGRPVIAAVGNAPTALIRLREMADEGLFRPELIIGVPVGFVNVVEAKELILETDIPHIVARGRKGGSNIAAAIVNALLYQVYREE